MMFLIGSHIAVIKYYRLNPTQTNNLHSGMKVGLS